MLDARDVNCSIGSFKLSLKSFLFSPLYKAACQELLKFDVWDEWPSFFSVNIHIFFISKNGAHKIFFCPLCHCCYIPRMWIRIRVYVWRWVSACKSIYTSMYVLVFTYISVHMGNGIFLLHISIIYGWYVQCNCCSTLAINLYSLSLSLALSLQSQCPDRKYMWVKDRINGISCRRHWH